MTYDLDWWLVGKPIIVDFLFALIELFSLSILVPELRGEMCSALLFSQGVDLFALKFYLDKVVSINHSWRRKSRDTRLPDSEDRIPLFSRFDTIPEVWRTDRRMDRLTNRRTDKSVHTAFAKLQLQLCKKDKYRQDKIKSINERNLNYNNLNRAKEQRYSKYKKTKKPMQLTLNKPVVKILGDPNAVGPQHGRRHHMSWEDIIATL